MSLTKSTLTTNSTTTGEIDYYDNGKGDNDKDITEMAGIDVNGDDAYTYDDDYHCHYDDKSYYIVLGIRSCGTVGKKNLTIGHLLNNFDTS